jgi:choline dehydrogenase-like flavoprotein
VLGGSSGINGMMHFRGDRSSYDAWEAAGATGWNYDALLPFFKRSERAVDGDPAYRGLDGPMQVAPAAAKDPLWEAAFDAAVQAGHAPTDDNNGATATGTSWHESNVVNGQRQSAADGYLVPAAGRPNLTIVADAHVRRLRVKHARCEGVEYLKDGKISAATEVPDVHAIFLDVPIHPRFAIGQEHGHSVIFALMNPSSRGSIRLASDDPERAPIINPRYLTDPSDMSRLTVGLHAAREIGSAPAFAHLRDEELFPGNQTRSDAACHAYLRRTVSTYFHPVGTCKIGTNGSSVVDAALKVHGIANLRIADASVMPSIVSGNTNAAVLAIAERAANLVTSSP